MKVAIAGTGPVATYLVEELKTAGHDVVVLTRSKKRELSIEQRETDYSIESLLSVIEDREALISTVSVYDDPSAQIKAHLDMLEACKQSKLCKTYIPSEWTLNAEDYPEQPMYFAEANKKIHDRLKEEKDIRWTIICNSWFIEYILPQKQRHLRDIGEIWPMNYESKVFTIYGPGTQLVDFTSVRDVARAVGALLQYDGPWDHYTHISGEQLSWNEIFAIVAKRDSQWTSKVKPMADSVRQIIENDSPLSSLIGQFEIQSYSGASMLRQDTVRRQRAEYYPGIHFRTVKEVIMDAAAQPDTVI